MRDRRRLLLLVVFALVVSLSAGALAQEKPSHFKDPQDGALDLSGWLATKTGFLPVVSPITEPAVGYGAALGLLFFHGGGLAGAREKGLGPTGRPIPPDVTAAGGLLTENGTWGAFVGHLGFWKGDRWRYRGALARVSPTLDYYGSGDRGFGFNLDGWGTFQEMARRVGKTDLFAGARFVYLDSDIHFDFDELPPEIPRPGFESTVGGFSLLLQYDTRDNIFTPRSGVNLEAVGTFFVPWLGSDSSYQDYVVQARGYWDIHPRLVLAARLRAESVAGDAPFYAQPYVNLRGIPTFRYQGETAVAIDGEVQWNVHGRWWVLAFAGQGWTGDDVGSLQGGWSVNAGGAGFRYLIARALGLQMGIDFAWGPEDSAFYVVTGSSF